MSVLGKGQFGDYDVAQRFARNVDAGPKAVGPEEHRGNIVAEDLKHPTAAHLLTLHQQPPVPQFKARAQRGGAVAQRLIVGKKHERPPAGHFDIVEYLLGQCRIVSVCGGTGHVARNVQFRLIRGEGRIQQQRPSGKTGTGNEIVEAPAYRQSRTAQHHREILSKQYFAEQFGDVQR